MTQSTPGTFGNILVVGAGIAGLTTAYWLDRYGFNVTVVERANKPRLGGQALDIRGPALEVAERMGILEALNARKTRLNGVSVVNGQGEELYNSTERTLTGGRLDSSDLEVLRDDLCGILLAALGRRVTMRYGDHLMSILTTENGVEVIFASSVPERFDVVIGADGLRSSVRRIAFGPDQHFLRYMGTHIGVFSVPNFLGLDHWQVLCQDGPFNGLVLGMDKTDPARAYLGFSSKTAIDDEIRDVGSQKQLIEKHYEGAGWEFPRLVHHMKDAEDFYFYSASQVRMESWSLERVVLVGDAGYSVTPASGQGTSIAMVCAHVLAGELAAHRLSLVDGIRSYENEVRAYVNRNLDLAFEMSNDDMESNESEHSSKTDSSILVDFPDFDQLIVPFALKDYHF
ncbi:FAD-dependent oxidoreductase [Neorhizobium sp. DAR64872/K0K18]|uniref:FAD-dependent oxidoreductase n=1 Tax=Neorhizobium sp. DAR64872/K0K18 TaxID=3421958 RepID=UPI003D2BA50A